MKNKIFIILLLAIINMSCSDDKGLTDSDVFPLEIGDCQPLTNEEARELGEAHNDFIYQHFIPIRDVFTATNCNPCFAEYETYLDTANIGFDTSLTAITQSQMAIDARDLLERADSINYDFTMISNTSLTSFYSDLDQLFSHEDSINYWDTQFVNLQREYLPDADCNEETIIRGVISIGRHSTCLWNQARQDSLNREIILSSRSGDRCVRAVVKADALAGALWLEGTAIAVGTGLAAAPGIGQVGFGGWVLVGGIGIGGSSLFNGIDEWWNGPGGHGGPAPSPKSNEDCPPD